MSLRILSRLTAAVALAGATGLAAPARAQQSPPPEVPAPIEVGATAPDIELPGATRYGVLEQPVHLSDFKGRTVVLAFFFRARSKG